MFKNTADQKLTVFAFDAATNLPKSGDAANITAYVQIDDGAVTVLGDTSATEQSAANATGQYIFDLAQAETNGDKLTFSAKSVTANIVVLALPAVVYTLPPAFTGLTVAQIATSIFQDTTAGDFTVAGSIGKGLYTGGHAPGASLGFWISDGTNDRLIDAVDTVTGNVNGHVGSVTGAVGSVTGNVGGNLLGFVAGGMEGDILGNLQGSVQSVTNPATIVAAVWNALLTALTTAGSIGAKLASAIFTGGFTGPSSVTLTFRDNLGAAVPNVEFTVLGQGSMRADSNGVAAFGINDGTYSVVANITNLIIFPTATLVVSGTTALTITGAAASIPAPPTPAQTTAYGVTRDAHGNSKGAVAVTFELENPDQAVDVYDGGEFTSTSDSSGNLLVVLLKGAKYGIKTPSGKFVEFTTTTADTQPLPNVLGPY